MFKNIVPEMSNVGKYLGWRDSLMNFQAGVTVLQHFNMKTTAKPYIMSYSFKNNES
jgi:hypothetical protein